MKRRVPQVFTFDALMEALMALNDDTSDRAIGARETIIRIMQQMSDDTGEPMRMEGPKLTDHIDVIVFG
jgi:hypothetical protein